MKPRISQSLSSFSLLAVNSALLRKKAKSQTQLLKSLSQKKPATTEEVHTVSVLDEESGAVRHGEKIVNETNSADAGDLSVEDETADMEDNDNTENIDNQRLVETPRCRS